MNPATLKEAVAHHAVAKQKKDDCQEEDKQEVPGSERGWLWSWGIGRIQWTGHKPDSNYLVNSSAVRQRKLG
jgi:hypothetical protein